MLEIEKITIQKLKSAADQKGWTQERLAKEARIQQSQVSRAFSMKSSVSLDTVILMAEALDIPLSELMKDAPLKPRKRLREELLTSLIEKALKLDDDALLGLLNFINTEIPAARGPKPMSKLENDS